MAYVDFSGDPVLAAYAGVDAPRPVRPDTGLSALEWSVVALARRDRVASLRQPGRLALAMGALFGTRHSRHLADPRLEALRRMAVFGWRRGGRVPAGEVAAFLRAGFSADQYHLVTASIGAAQSRGESRA